MRRSGGNFASRTELAATEARLVAQRDADRRVTLRTDEVPPVKTPLGPLVGMKRRVIFEAPYPCRVNGVSIVSDVEVANALSTYWLFLPVRRGRDYLSGNYRALILEKNPGLYLTLDDSGDPSLPSGDLDDDVVLTGTAIALDETGNQNGGHVGSPTLQVDGGPVGQQLAISYDGTGSQYTVVPSVSVGVDGAFAMDIWFRPLSDVVTDAQIRHLCGADIAAGGARASSFPTMALRPSKSGEPNGIAIWTPAGGGQYVARTSDFQGWQSLRWNLATYVRASSDPSTDKIYVNGIDPPINYPATVAYVEESVKLILAKSSVADAGTSLPFPGALDEFVVYPAGNLTLQDHRERYGALTGLATKDLALPADARWSPTTAIYSEMNTLMEAGDVVLLEANPIGQVVPIDSADAIVDWEPV